MTTFTGPDFKQAGRHVASRSEWDRIVLAKAGPCRGCGAPGESFHHLVSRSLRGDDTEANIVPLCGDGVRGCHGALETHTAGWEAIGHAVRHSLTPLELQYVLAKKGRKWIDRYLPAGDLDLCANCRKPKSLKTSEPRRKRKRWSILVPDDGEDGASTLDALVEACAVELRDDLGYEVGTPHYFPLVAVLTDWLQSRRRVVA